MNYLKLHYKLVKSRYGSIDQKSSMLLAKFSVLAGITLIPVPAGILFYPGPGRDEGCPGRDEIAVPVGHC